MGGSSLVLSDLKWHAFYSAQQCRQGNTPEPLRKQKKYTDEHDLERLVTQMVNYVVTMKPHDPEAFMVRWLLERCNLDQAESTGIKIVKELPKRQVDEDRSREA